VDSEMKKYVKETEIHYFKVL